MRGGIEKGSYVMRDLSTEELKHVYGAGSPATKSSYGKKDGSKHKSHSRHASRSDKKHASRSGRKSSHC